jgi:hypothetical protein
VQKAKEKVRKGFKNESLELIEELSGVRKLHIFHVMMLCEQDECLRAKSASDIDVNVASTKILPTLSVKSPDGSTIYPSNPSRFCPLDDKVLLALDVLSYEHGIKHQVQARDRSRSSTAKIEFIFQACDDDQSESLLAAANILKEIAAKFPSLFMRYIPALLKSLKHSLSRKTVGGKSIDRKVFDAMQHDLNSGRMTTGKVAFRFTGDDVNDLLWEIAFSVLNEIPSVVLYHPRSTNFGVEALREEFQQLYTKREVVNFIFKKKSLNEQYFLKHVFASF